MLGQTRTQLTSTDTEVRRCNHRQQRNKTHANQDDHEAAKTTVHQPHRSCRGDLAVDGRHASRPTPNQPGVQGCNGNGVEPVGDTVVRHARRRPDPRTKQNAVTLPLRNRPPLTNYAEPLNDRPTDRNDLLQTPGPPGERKLDRVRRRECAPQHASPVACASSSRLTPTENQPRWGCLQDRAYGLAAGPWAPESGGCEDVRWDPPPRIIRPKEMSVRLRSNMSYLSPQNPLQGAARGDRTLPQCAGAALWGHVQ